MRISIESTDAADYFSSFALPLGLKADEIDYPWDKCNRATFTLLNAGGRYVLITCQHVLAEFRKLKASNAQAKLVGYVTFRNMLVEVDGLELVDENLSLDVAIFRGTESVITLPDDNKTFIDYATSYSSDVNVGDSICVVGYPAANVKISTVEAHFGYTYLLLKASSVSERHVILANENGNWSFKDFRDTNYKNIPLGGLSGSPAFVIRNDMPRFIGIVKDGTDRDQTIIISRLGCLNADGTLDAARMPW